MSKFELLKFMPFRLNRLAAEVSAALSTVYQHKYGLDIPEWRVLATLGDQGCARSAQYVVQSTRTHKSTISRAVTTLIERKLVVRITNEDDRREQLLRLTASGQALFEELVPQLLSKERGILDCLSQQERKTFGMLVSKLEQSMDLTS